MELSIEQMEVLAEKIAARVIERLEAPPPPTENELIDIRTLAKNLNVNHSRLYERIGKDIPGIKVGGQWRFDLYQVRKELAENAFHSIPFDFRRSIAAKRGAAERRQRLKGL